MRYRYYGQETTNGTQLAVLMDIRDELKALNRLLHCQNFLDIHDELRKINKALAKRKPRRKAV